MPNNTERVMVIKSALVSITSMPGWGYFKQMANNVVQKAVQEALDEEDPQQGESKRLKAKAMQKGFSELFNAVEVTKGWDDADTTSGLGSLEFEDGD